MVRTPDFDPVLVFAEIARKRFGATTVNTRKLETVPSGAIVEYRSAERRVFLERMASGEKIALSLFVSTAENQALLDDVNNILVRTKLMPQ